MKKHVAGFALFCFIIGAAAFVSGVLAIFFDYANVFVNSPEKIYTKTKLEMDEVEAANGSIDKKSPIITQAVFNSLTKQINLEMIFRDDVALSGKVPVKLNYFRNTAEGVRFIKSETVNLIYESFYLKEKSRTASITCSYEWLDNLDSYENLYVTAEFPEKITYSKSEISSAESDADSSKSKFIDIKMAAPKFDPEFAKEITLYWGKSKN
ncbi:MAG TPA: hypothetical protein VGC76_07715 [Pyrinomonadaceae bacterium]|jgi:hypothetical protein